MSSAEPGSDAPQPGARDFGEGLPRIGAPATRALHQRGIVSLADVARHTREDLSDLHGVGPRALRLLEEALAEHGGSFAAPEPSG